MVYMGSKTSEEEHPDDILTHNHQILAAVHGGRSALLSSPPLLPFSFCICIFISIINSTLPPTLLLFFSYNSIEQARASHLYSYSHGFRGFAAKLTDHQASQISSKSNAFSCYFLHKLLLLSILQTSAKFEFISFLSFLFFLKSKQRCLE